MRKPFWQWFGSLFIYILSNSFPLSLSAASSQAHASSFYYCILHSILDPVFIPYFPLTHCPFTSIFFSLALLFTSVLGSKGQETDIDTACLLNRSRTIAPQDYCLHGTQVRDSFISWDHFNDLMIKCEKWAWPTGIYLSVVSISLPSLFIVQKYKNQIQYIRLTET